MSTLSPDARTRAADLFDHLAEPAMARLMRRYPGADPQAVADAVVEAVLHVARQPLTDDAGLERAVTEAARQRLRTTLRGDTRRRRREIAAAGVTRPPTGGPSPDVVAERRELAADFRAVLAPTANEQPALELWLAGVTAPAELAARLGTDHGSAVRQLARFRQRAARLRAARREGVR